MGPIRLLLAKRGRFLKRYLRVMISLARQRDLLAVPEMIEGVEGGRVLILSPHCDDDVIGMGGMMLRHGIEGHDVTVLYFTGTGEIRAEEARKATSLLGRFDLRFLGLPEGRLRPDGALADTLAGVIEETAPDVLYLPWFLDQHRDHLAVNELLLRAYPRCRQACTVYGYEVWTPLLPNRLLDITEHVEIKKEALSRYASQLAEVDLVATTLALNRYRSATNLHGKGYAEAFLRMELGAYVRMVSRR